jgi:putative flavoprotein involved in K+ transport
MALFLPDAFWRDCLAFTWNLHTAEGHAAIREMLDECLARTAPTLWQALSPARRDKDVVEAPGTFETAVARCSAVIRLKNGKCWTLLTSMTELQGFQDSCGSRRPLGQPLHYQLGRKSWRRARRARARHHAPALLRDRRAGHCGLSLGAVLKQLNVPTLILDKRGRPSDIWCDRHETLSLHSPSWFDHMPYFAYPEGWPLHPSKDQFANWLDAYRTLMDLDVWTDAECLSTDFDDGHRQSNGIRRRVARHARASDALPCKGAPLRQCDRASLL